MSQLPPSGQPAAAVGQFVSSDAGGPGSVNTPDAGGSGSVTGAAKAPRPRRATDLPPPKVPGGVVELVEVVKPAPPDKTPPLRTQARRKAVELLFEADQRGTDVIELVVDRELLSYTAKLLQGVAARMDEIGEMLDTYSQGWPRAQMPGLDRAALTLGAYEVVFEDDVPDEVVMKDLADMVGEYSTDKSAGFVSGLLGRLSNIKETLR